MQDARCSQVLAGSQDMTLRKILTREKKVFMLLRARRILLPAMGSRMDAFMLERGDQKTPPIAMLCWFLHAGCVWGASTVCGANVNIISPTPSPLIKGEEWNSMNRNQRRLLHMLESRWLGARLCSREGSQALCYCMKPGPDGTGRTQNERLGLAPAGSTEARVG